jgi:hypothetical protein
MKQAALSIRVLYHLSTAAYLLGIIATLLGILVAFGFLFGAEFIAEDFRLTIKMPVAVDLEQTGSVVFFGKEIEVRIIDAVGAMEFYGVPPFILRLMTIPVLIMLPIMFLGVYLFHRFMRNVYYNRIFDAVNFYLLRKLSYVLLAIWVLTVLYIQSLKYALMGDFSYVHIGISTNSDWYWGILAGALFLWVLSHIFLKGLELKEENELTI